MSSVYCVCGHSPTMHQPTCDACPCSAYMREVSDVAPEFLGVQGRYVPPTPRLVRLSSDQWVDPDEIVALRTSTNRVTYNRLVHGTLANGNEFTVTAVQVKPNSMTGENDERLAAWLREKFSTLLGDLDD